MSADPTPPPDSDPTPPKSPADPATGENAEAFRQKRRFKRGGEEQEEGGEKPDQAIEILSSLLQDLVAKKEQRPAAPEAPAAPPKSAKYHRLSKTGSGNATAPTEPASPAVETLPQITGNPAPVTAEAPLPAAPPAAPPPAVAFRPAPTVDLDVENRRVRVWRTLFLVSLLGLVGLGSYVAWFMRSAGGAEPVAVKASALPDGAWTDDALRQLDNALAADQAGDVQTARSLAAAIPAANGTVLPGLALYLANLDSRLERNYDAEADLLRLTKNASPETLAAVEAGLGFNFARTRDFEKATEAYNTATRNDPFSAVLFYQAGEIARHLGHVPDAIASFRRALSRVPNGQPEMMSLRDCVGLKLRLCLLEGGQEAEFQTELGDQLQAPSPSGYWLLTAAAAALQRKDFAGAAGFLGRARGALGETTFDGLLNDYFFRTYADRKELAEFFPDPTTRRAKLLPTRTHTIDP